MKIDLKGLNELSKRAKKLDGENIVSIDELFSKEFLEKYSAFSSFDEMIDMSGFKLENEEDFSKLSENEDWEFFIIKNTSFNSFEEMENEAAKEYVFNQLFK